VRVPVSVTPDKISHRYTSFQPCAELAVVSLGRDGNLENPIALMGEQVVGFLDLVELEAMRDERAKIYAARARPRSPVAACAPCPLGTAWSQWECRRARRGFHCRPSCCSRHRSLGGNCQHGRSLLWLTPSPLICSSVIFVTSASKSALERFSQMCFRRRARSFRTQSSLLSRLSESG
jgi:hypothetical protein